MSKTIIVIDDSAIVREELNIVLSEAEYRVVEAEDGIEGADAIQCNPDALLAICDVNMPRVDGLAMLDRLRAQGNVNVPVVMLTSEVLPSLVERARAAGAKGWMIKPIKPLVLLATVKKLARAIHP